MKTAYLAVGDRTFTLPLDEVEEVMSAAATARERGEWLDFRDASGQLLRLLIPSQALLIIREHETNDEFVTVVTDANDWSGFDYDF